MGFIGSNFWLLFFTLRWYWPDDDAPLELRLLFTGPLDFRLLESIADHVSVPDSDGAAGLLLVTLRSFLILFNKVGSFLWGFNYWDESLCVTLTHYCLKSVITIRIYDFFSGPSIGLSTPSSSILTLLLFLLLLRNFYDNSVGSSYCNGMPLT